MTGRTDRSARVVDGAPAHRADRRPRTRAALAACLCLVVSLGAAAAGTVDLPSIAGVYKKRFPNSTVSGERYTSEDIVEIVPTSASTAYLKAHFEFYNGHVCDIRGVADVEGSTLRYHDPASDDDGGERCVLAVRVTAGQLVFEDAEARCKLRYCGARGSFDGERIERRDRRGIRYMNRLKSSKDFADAVAEHQAR